MEKEVVYFYNMHDLENVLKEHPNYTKVYFKAVKEDGKLVLSLSKHAGDQLYLVSNKDYDDLEMYLKGVKTEVTEKITPRAEKISIPKELRTVDEPVKKHKCQDLFSFIKKTN